MKMFRRNSYKKKKALPIINMSLASDLVFILLIFILLIFKIREYNIPIKTELPRITESKKLGNGNTLFPIFIGRPSSRYQSCFSGVRISFGDSFISINDVPMIFGHRNNFSKNQSEVVLLVTDKNIKMGIVADVKEMLQKCSQYKIAYAAYPELGVL